MPASAIEAGRDHIPTLDEAGAAASAKATLEATLPLWRASGRPTGEMDEQAWADMVAFMRSAGLITADVAADCARLAAELGFDGGDCIFSLRAALRNDNRHRLALP